MAKKQFKAESKRLLDLMINSIYTNKEIFLREIISNASDAIDKLHYKSLTDKSIKLDKEDLNIYVEINKEERTLRISDNGIDVVGTEVDQVTKDLVESLVDEDSGLITLYYGEDISEEDANALSDYLAEKYEDLDVDVRFGGQPIYYYILSVE